MTLCNKSVMMSHLHLRPPSLSMMARAHVSLWDKANVSHNCGVPWVICSEQQLFWCCSKITSATNLQSLLSRQI